MIKICSCSTLSIANNHIFVIAAQQQLPRMQIERSNILFSWYTEAKYYNQNFLAT